ncbi:MAG: hypothetical protein ACRD5D_05995 [Candidatus Polarisedimenticolia bacterium]
MRRGAIFLTLLLPAALAAPACEKGTHRAARRTFEELMTRALPPADRAAALERFVTEYPEPKTNPYLKRACMLLADHRTRAGRPDLGASWLERAVRADADDPDLLNALGYHYARHGMNLDRAKDVLEKAVRLSEERDLPPRRQGFIKDSLGWCYRMRGELALAVALLEEAGRLAPDTAIIRQHLAETYRALGERERAADLYLDLIRTAGGEEPAYRKALAELGREGGPAYAREIERRLRDVQLQAPGR